MLAALGVMLAEAPAMVVQAMFVAAMAIMVAKVVFVV